MNRMLDVIGAGNPDYNGPDYGDVWTKSETYKQQSKAIEEMIEKRKNAEQSKSLKDDREYAMPLSVQTMAVMKRSFVAFWRTPNCESSELGRDQHADIARHSGYLLLAHPYWFVQLFHILPSGLCLNRLSIEIIHNLHYCKSLTIYSFLCADKI